MHKRYSLFLMLVLVLATFAGQAIASKITKLTIEEGMQREKLADPFDQPYTSGQGIPLQPGLVLESPGYSVGTTHYDYQTNCSTGNRVMKDGTDGIHVCWMNGIDFWTGNRWVYYNFRDETGSWAWPDVGTQVSSTEGAGYTNLDVLADGRAAITYHSVNNEMYTVVAIDVLRGFGVFTEYDVPDEVPAHERGIWPYVHVDPNDRIHVVQHEYLSSGSDPKTFWYTRSDDYGSNWTNPAVIDTGMDISTIVVTSPASQKAAVIYPHPRNMAAPDQYNNDVIYVESLDGTNWDFVGGKVNITNYQTMDTLRAYCDMEAVYDHNDQLHILWTTPYYDEINGLITVDACLLWHWSENTGTNLVANGWWVSAPGAWNRSISKMSLAVDGNNNLYAMWTQFTDDDKSVGGWSNGEIYAAGSSNSGTAWNDPVNLTNSPTPDCWPGECDSDHWSSLAETVDDSLYILYINDKDAGGMPQTEGVDTENPVKYYAVHRTVVLEIVGVDEDKETKPTTFVLRQNFPNPFNASTTIEYVTRTPGEVDLVVYNLRGEEIEVLVDQAMPAGEHTVTWDAGDVASGVYYYKLTTTEGTIAKRALLLK